MLQTSSQDQTLYPDSDGKPRAENTLQYQWTVHLVENLKRVLAGQNAFVAGNLLWYPVQAQPGQIPVAQAPDAMVVIGCPDQYRGSYKQWEDENIAPQVVFEIISPSNSAAEISAKQAFYIEHGVLEMYFYHPQSEMFWGLVRTTLEDKFEPVMPPTMPWVSPLLQIRFAVLVDGLAVFYPDGEPFKTLAEFAQERDQVQQERDRSWRPNYKPWVSTRMRPSIAPAGSDLHQDIND